MPQNWTELADRLVKVLHLSSAPVAITFAASPPLGIDRFDTPMPPATEDGRRGRVPAGCVFWMHGAERAFSTVPEDHGNCSVGSVTHGLLAPGEVIDRSDVAELVGAGWVGPSVFDQLPKVATRPGSVVYAPLSAVPIEPDVVLLRVNARQLMVLSDALAGPVHRGQAPVSHRGHGQGTGGSGGQRRLRPQPATDGYARRGDDLCPAGRATGHDDRGHRGDLGIDGAVARYAAEDARRFA